jgi:hypothetical protein
MGWETELESCYASGQEWYILLFLIEYNLFIIIIMPRVLYWNLYWTVWRVTDEAMSSDGENEPDEDTSSDGYSRMSRSWDEI